MFVDVDIDLSFPERKVILDTVGLDSDMRTLERADLFSWDDCEQIWNDYTSKENISRRQEVCQNLLIELQKLGNTTYFTKVRPKEPISLIRKIIKNKQNNLDKYGPVTPRNYMMFVTDLIGARILIRSKTEWKTAHKYLCDIFDAVPRAKITTTGDYVLLFVDDPDAIYFAEDPVAYVVSDNELPLYRENGKDIVKTKKSDRGYRSIHYIVKYMNHYVEIQVRSIFEEGWSECDHDLVYKIPEGRKKIILRRTSKILSELAHQADELVDFMSMINDQQPVNCNYPNEDCYAKF